MIDGNRQDGGQQRHHDNNRRNDFRRRRHHGRHGGQGGQGGGGHGQHPHGGQNRGSYHHGGRSHSEPQPPKRTDAEKLFLEKTPVAPFQWLQFEKGSSEFTMRAVDLLSPVGKGQRGLIVSPPKVGKTTILKHLCQSIAAGYPDVKVFCLLVDERPEEVTDFKRSVTCEIFASCSDRPYVEHIKTAERVYHLAVEEAVAGKDVVIVLDSLTRLARAHNTAATGNKTMSGGLDSRAMEIPRRFFGCARKLEEGGSITILATILIDTNSRMDEVIFQEFKGTGNMELVLSRPAADLRVFPAIHVKNSGTRREELLLTPKDLEAAWQLRRKLASMSDLEATKLVVELLKRFPTNEKLLAGVQGGVC